jgi:hypothetical protein
LGGCVVLAVAFSGVVVAQASAASIAVTQACVVNADSAVGSPMIVRGTGFVAGDSVNLQTTKGSAFGTTTADPTGSFTVTMTAPTLGTSKPAFSSFVLQAMDSTTGAASASTSFDVANLAVATNPSQGKPSKKVTWSFSGFISGAEIYAHYLHGKQVTATAKFGRAQGSCGTLKKKAVFYPGTARYDSYRLQIDDARRYLATSLPRFIATLKTHVKL